MAHLFRFLVLLALAASAAAQTATVRVRGVLLAVSDQMLTVKANSGEAVELVLPATLVVQEVFPVARSEIKAGSFIGTAALPQPDGTRRAIAVMVFPESARGTGEGDRPFDLLPQSTMTNAMVNEISEVADGHAMQLKHKDGQARIIVPDDAPIVSFERGGRSALVVGASVSIAAQAIGGRPTAQRINVGRNGFVLPY
jgi:hypothetical protein